MNTPFYIALAKIKGNYTIVDVDINYFQISDRMFHKHGFRSWTNRKTKKLQEGQACIFFNDAAMSEYNRKIHQSSNIQHLKKSIYE